MLINTSSKLQNTLARPLKHNSSKAEYSSTPDSTKDKVEISFTSKLGQAASGLISTATTAATALDAFPQFIYPSIFDATAGERAQILEGLDNLPLHHVGGIDTVNMVPSLPFPEGKPGWVTLGMAHDYGLTNDILLSRKELTTPQGFQDTLIHEVGHTVDYNSKPLPFIGGNSSHSGYGSGNMVSEYAHTNEKEDYAESYQEFQQRPDNLKKVSPEKYAEQKATSSENSLQKLVDRKEFRETGKFIADLAPNKATRQTIEGLRRGAGVIGALNGIQQWTTSGATGNPMQHVSGILNTASGVLSFAGAPLAGVGLQAANLALSKAVKRGALSAEEVESTVALPVRPLESVLGRKASKIDASHRSCRVLSVGLGGAVGGMAGTLVGPYLGVLGGYHLAGAAGGAIGLVAGGVLGFVGGTALGEKAGEALANLAA